MGDDFFMRIAFLSWEALYGMQVGGLAVHITKMAEALSKLGHEVHIFTRMAPGQSAYDKINEVHYHRCPFDLNPDFIQEMNNMSRSFAWHLFREEHEHGRFDVIHGHDWHIVNGLAEIKHRLNRSVLWTVHSTEFGRCGNKFSGGISEHIRGIEFYGTYISKKIVACSNAMKEEAKWLYRVPEEKLAVVENGIDAKEYEGTVDPGSIKNKYGIGPVDPTILFVGRMAYQKGPDLLVDAIPQILRNNSQARFVFVGDGYMRSWVEQKSWWNGVAHATRFLGYLPRSDLLALYKSAEAVAIPSRNEPFGLVVLEAWASCKPVVATNIGGPGELVEHEKDGFKVYLNPNSIAWGVSQILQDNDRAVRMGINGRIKVEEKYSWLHKAKQLSAVYEQTIRA